MKNIILVLIFCFSVLSSHPLTVNNEETAIEQVMEEQSEVNEVRYLFTVLFFMLLICLFLTVCFLISFTIAKNVCDLFFR